MNFINFIFCFHIQDVLKAGYTGPNQSKLLQESEQKYVVTNYSYNVFVTKTKQPKYPGIVLYINMIE